MPSESQKSAAKSGMRSVFTTPWRFSTTLATLAGPTWSRRAKTIPIMLGATLVGCVAFPIIAPIAVLWDIIHGRWRLPSIRVALFLLQYGINDCVEIILAGPLWIVAGFGRRLDSKSSIARHQRLQAWSVGVLARRAEHLLGLRIHMPPDAIDTLAPGPVIVLCRHVSLFDASLPFMLYHRLSLPVRGVIMAELLADPAFDLLYRRSGSVFIPRENGPEALAALSTFGSATKTDADGERTVVLIFPEGRLFRPELLQRFMGRMKEQDPTRAYHLDSIRHVLPPKPGGTLALLHALPDADVVVIAHAGLDGYSTFTELAKAVPLPTRWDVTAWRIPRSEIPADAADQARWLDDQWLSVDRWVENALHP